MPAPATPRYLLVTADDFGAGVETSRGILDLAARGVVTSTVLLTTSPYAVESVALWRKLGSRPELGWHPCLTLDAPILPPDRVPTLVGADGRFLSLGGFLKRLIRGRVNPAEVEAEFRAQYRRFVDLVGHLPANVNGHHHVHIFRPVGDALARVLADQVPRPYLRRVVEPWRTLARISGARVKRAVLSRVGGRAAGRQYLARLPGNEWLLGVTDPPFVHAPDFFVRWLRAAPGRFVELTCHPGYYDPSLDGRDGTALDGQLDRRPTELDRLRDPRFRAAVATAGFTLVTAEELVQLSLGKPVVRLAAA
jgi:predicted glycoside hydrolase/deacetylase ChbG (UPF0249 family)